MSWYSDNYCERYNRTDVSYEVCERCERMHNEEDEEDEEDEEEDE